MKNKGLYILAITALFLFAFKKKKKSRVTLETKLLNNPPITATKNAKLYKGLSDLSILWTFQGGEWLTILKEYDDILFVEYSGPKLLRGYIAREDVKNFR